MPRKLDTIKKAKEGSQFAIRALKMDAISALHKPHAIVFLWLCVFFVLPLSVATTEVYTLWRAMINYLFFSITVLNLISSGRDCFLLGLCVCEPFFADQLHHLVHLNIRVFASAVSDSLRTSIRSIGERAPRLAIDLSYEPWQRVGQSATLTAGTSSFQRSAPPLLMLVAF